MERWPVGAPGSGTPGSALIRRLNRWEPDPGPPSNAAAVVGRSLAPSLRRASEAEIERMLGLYRDLHRGFTVKNFHEQLIKRHNYVLGYTVTKLHLHRAWCSKPRSARLIARSVRAGR
jgi:hypothetical protein